MKEPSLLKEGWVLGRGFAWWRRGLGSKKPVGDAASSFWGAQPLSSPYLHETSLDSG